MSVVRLSLFPALNIRLLGHAVGKAAQNVQPEHAWQGVLAWFLRECPFLRASSALVPIQSLHRSHQASTLEVSLRLLTPRQATGL